MEMVFLAFPIRKYEMSEGESGKVSEFESKMFNFFTMCFLVFRESYAMNLASHLLSKGVKIPGNKSCGGR